MLEATKADERTQPWPRGPKAGWMGADLNKEALTADFGRRELQALRSSVAAVVQAGKSLAEISRQDFADPDLARVMRKLDGDLKIGPGLAFLRGVDVENYSVDELRILFVGLGTYFGKALSQSKYGDMLGEVTPQAGREGDKRGYVVDRALPFHTDHSEIFGLFCIVDAQEGGENLFLSTLKVYEIVQNEHPEYLPLLKRGWRLWLVDEQRPGMASVTPHRVPVFAEVDGVLSGVGVLGGVERCAEALGEELTPEERAAIRYTLAVRARPELHFEAALAPGEAVFINNFEVLHARKGLTHWPDRKRHLLRLWLQGDPQRPLPPEFPVYRFMNESGRQGVDALPSHLIEIQLAECQADPVSRFMRAEPA